MSENFFSICFTKTIASVFLLSSFLILSGSAPASAACDYDHAGANWTPINGDAYDLDTSGAIAIAGEHCNIKNFIIPIGVNVYVYPFDGTNYGKLIINATNATIDGALVATGRGYDSSSGPGAGGASYGSITNPSDLGSGGSTTFGGGYSAPGGRGGGLIKLIIAGTLTNNGSIVANGNNGTDGVQMNGSRGGAGGGSGGTIYLSSGTFAGNGSFSANGGNGGISWYGVSGGAGAGYGGAGTGGNDIGGGGGGGGRIAFYSASTMAALTAYGGSGGGNYAGAGTIYTKAASQINGDLLIDNNGNAGAATPMIDAANTFSNLTVQKAASLSVPAAKSLSTTNFTLNTNGTFTTVGSMAASNLIVDRGTFYLNTNLSVNPASNVAFNGISNLIIGNNSTLTHDANTNSKTNYLDWNIGGELIVQAGSSINVDGKGYSAGNGISGGTGTGTGGGGHGGVGGSGAGGVGGAVNDSTTGPLNLGSGSSGASGGGYVKFILGSATIDGSLSAKGNAGGLNTGGGGGGSIWLNILGGLSGIGPITADGGAGNGNGGGGGGGIIYITHDPMAGKLFGWARALSACKDSLWNGTNCTGSGAGDKSGGWDGWIKLRKDANDTPTSPNYGISLLGNDFMGYAWGSDVVSWLCFNNFTPGCDLGAAGPAYKVYLKKTPPNATNLSVTGPITPCQFNNKFQFSWNYKSLNNPALPQKSYQVRIYDDVGRTNKVYDTGKNNSATNSVSLVLGNSVFNKTLYWDLMVWDSIDTPSSLITPAVNGFPAQDHQYPDVNFSPPAPSNFVVNSPIQFCTDYSVAPCNGMADKTNKSVCYDINNIAVPCDINGFIWNFGDQAINPFNPVEDIKKNPVHAYTSLGSYNVILTATDAFGKKCSSVDSVGTKTLNMIRPKWKEVVPR